MTASVEPELIARAHLRELIACAAHWWAMKRPQGRDVNWHLENPTVNCASPSECGLARIVARVVAERNMTITTVTKCRWCYMTPPGQRCKTCGKRYDQ